MKYIIDFDIDEISAENLKKYCSEITINDKQKIVTYLKETPLSAFTSSPVIDVFTGKEVYAADNAHSDSIYCWYESEIYYFEKYNLQLKPEFIEYICKKISLD